MLTVGSVVAGYRIERVLGAGGMGAVYLVANPELPRRDALKVLNAELSLNDEFRTRFIREADVASMLDHPNIVSIYRRGHTPDGLLWIAMQYVDGVDADGALKSGQMTPARAVHIVSEVGKALDHAHIHGVIHRDIKPANFLLSGPAGFEERVLLGDFGIARAADDAGLTATGSLVATIAYAAPEVLAGQPIDGRADLYSLGCTLFRLLTGKTPYSTANGMPAVMMAHMQAPPPRVTDHAPGLPPVLDAIIAKAMAKDPAHRFSSARELAMAAGAALRDTAQATQSARWHPIAPADVTSYPNNPTTVAPPAGSYNPTGFAVAATQHGPARIDPASLMPAPSQRRRRTLLLTGLALTAVLTMAAAAIGAIVMNHHARPAQPAAAPSSSTTTTTTTSAGPPPPPLTPQQLDSLLLPPDHVAQIMGASKLAVHVSADTLIDDSPVIDKKQCIGTLSPAQFLAYRDSGFTAARVQAVHEPGDVPVAFEVLQAVIEFPTADLAAQQFSSAVAAWTACAGTPYVATYPGLAPQNWLFGPLSTKNDVLAIATIWNGGPGQMPQTGACQHAIKVSNNVIADMVACRIGITDQAVELAEATLAKVPH